MRRLAVTSWSLHSDLTSGALPLLELPAQARAAGIGTLELCHFHLPDTQPATLAAFRQALEQAGVELWSVLIDAGDLSTADLTQREADLRFVEHWIDTAHALGAQGVRVVAGDSAPDDTAALERCIAGLRHAADYAGQRGLRVRTENFRALLSTPTNCLSVLDALDGQVGLCADIGNFPPATRLEDFRMVIGRAEVVHVKADYAGTTIKAEPLRACLDASLAQGFNGPYTLVYDRGGDSWAGLAALAEVVGVYV